MRLSTAVGILAQVIIPDASAEEVSSFLRQTNSEGKRFDSSFLGGATGNIRQMLFPIRRKARMDNGPHAAAGSRDVLKNKTNEVECNPDSIDPDVGILSCAMGSYCVESEDSYFGGICVELADQRQLQSNNSTNLTYFDFYCDPAFANLSPVTYYFNCDCSGYNHTLQAGQFSCISKGLFCLPPENNTTPCYERALNATVAQGYVNGLKSCENWMTPYQSQVCYFYDFSTANSTLTCSVDGVACLSCAKQFYFPFYCLEFDCSNTQAKSVGLGFDANLNCPVQSILPIGNVAVPPTTEASTPADAMQLPGGLMNLMPGVLFASAPSAVPGPPTEAPVPIITSPPDGVAAGAVILSLNPIIGLASIFAVTVAHFAV